MSDSSNVIPFRKRPPSDIEVEVYERMTRNWHPELREMMFPEHFKREQDRKEG
jgi:hypothetical protein